MPEAGGGRICPPWPSTFSRGCTSSSSTACPAPSTPGSCVYDPASQGESVCSTLVIRCQRLVVAAVARVSASKAAEGGNQHARYRGLYGSCRGGGGYTEAV